MHPINAFYRLTLSTHTTHPTSYPPYHPSLSPPPPGCYTLIDQSIDHAVSCHTKATSVCWWTTWCPGAPMSPIACSPPGGRTHPLPFYSLSLPLTPSTLLSLFSPSLLSPSLLLSLPSLSFPPPFLSFNLPSIHSQHTLSITRLSSAHNWMSCRFFTTFTTVYSLSTYTNPD